jgi:hypothetical protein
MVKEGMKIEGDPVKRYGLSYGGQSLGSFHTAKEAWESYRQHDQLIRPVTDRKKQWRYSVRDGRREISIAELGQRAKREP